MSPESISQATRRERFGSTHGPAYRARSDAPSEDAEPPNGAAATTGFEQSSDKPRLPSLDLDTPPEPVFTPDSWLDSQAGSLADHPLLRGLLLELPPKGSTPPPGWLDRWFEATRSILELLYVK